MMLQERTTTSTTALTTRGRQHEKQSRVEFTTYKLPSKHMRLGSHIYTISLPFEKSPADPATRFLRIITSPYKQTLLEKLPVGSVSSATHSILGNLISP